MTTGTEDQEDGLAGLPDGGEIAYQIRGGSRLGTPVVLLRPLGGSTAIWGLFRTLLTGAFRVIALDHRGNGRSSAAPVGVTTRGLARDAIHVLDHLGIARAHVFGLSLGGMAATWLALLAPSRVARLCLASTPARGIELSHAGVRRELALAACFARPLPEVEPALVHRVLSHGFREAHPDQVRLIESTVRADPSTRTALIKHALAGLLHDARRELGRIHAPTLVLAGRNDHLLGLEAPRALAAGIPGATFEVIADAGHDLTLEQPSVTAARVARFFAEPPVD